VYIPGPDEEEEEEGLKQVGVTYSVNKVVI
jgi:hypothetical protein